MLTANGPVGSSNIRTYTGPAGTGYGLLVIQGATDDAVALPTVANVACVGINNETDIANSGVLGIVMSGETIAIAGAVNIAAGTYLVNAIGGQLIPSTAIGDNVTAKALTSSVNIGDEIVVEMTRFIR